MKLDPESSWLRLRSVIQIVVDRLVAMKWSCDRPSGDAAIARFAAKLAMLTSQSRASARDQ